MPFSEVKFRTLLDYRLYLLSDTRATVDSYDRKIMSTKRKAMHHPMYNHEVFDGSEPVYAMKFLGIFAHHCDREQVHEGMACELFANTLKGDAQHEYTRNHQHERSLAPGLVHWSWACHWVFDKLCYSPSSPQSYRRSREPAAKYRTINPVLLQGTSEQVQASWWSIW